MVAPTSMIDEYPTADELLDAALGYARAGWACFPLHTPINGICDCPKGPACASPGKHPRTLNGLKDASTDELKIRRWWKTYSIANIGVAVPEGYVIVDVDGDEGWTALKNAQRGLPATAIQTTGRGSHYVYRTLDRIPPRSGLMEKVDLRGPGSYIVGAPSVHASGSVYRWEIPLDQVDIAPDWLVTAGKHSGGTHDGDRAPVDFQILLAGLPEGQRKWELYRAASKLRAADVPLDLAVMLALQAAENCQPPLEAKEAERKVREAYDRYPPNASAKDLPAGVTLLAHDSVMVEFETCRFVFSDLEKSGRELHAEMEVQSLLPGTPQEPYVQRLNLLSMSARDQARREIEHVLGNPVKGQWTALFSRAITQAQNAILSVDRSVKASDIEAPDELRFVIPDVCVEDGFSILFGEGSAGKTWLLMLMAICVSRGLSFLGRPVERRNVLYVDCETGRKTFGYRIRRLMEGLGLHQEDADNIFFWSTDGVPFDDQWEAIKRCCDENEIGFIALDHIAAACSGDANEQLVANRFARAVAKIGRPMMALAHITGADMKNPEAVNKPFGSIFWHNLARRTIFVLRQQEDESEIADLGLYPKKVNDGRRPSPFAARITFEDPSGPISVASESLSSTPALSRVRGQEHVIYDALKQAMTVAEIHDVTDISERHIKRLLVEHPKLFVAVSGSDVGGRGNPKRWGRVGRDAPLWYEDRADEQEGELPW